MNMTVKPLTIFRAMRVLGMLIGGALATVFASGGFATNPASLAVPAGSPVPDTIVFDPAVPTLNNPSTPNTTTSPTTLTMTFTAYDANGHLLEPSAENPLYVKIYGAPLGAISPVGVQLTSGNTASFRYRGQYLPNNLTVEAWIYDQLAGIPASEPGGPVVGGYAMGVTQIAPQNRIARNYGTQSSSLTAVSGHVPPDQFVIDAAVGYTDPQNAAENYKCYTVDTGSLGLVVPLTDLPNLVPHPSPTASAPVIGPGPRGTRLYTSSGNTFTGYYYLAPVTFKTSSGGTVQTIPLQVLGVNRASCAGATYSCSRNPPHNPPMLHYLGIGFNREIPHPGDLFLSPGQNAFLNIKNNNTSRGFITQGYILAQNAPNITLGLTEAVASRFSQNLVTLAPNPALPGEWNDIQGSFSFPDLPGAPEFCGGMLLDVGINEMLMGVDSSSIPQPAQTPGVVYGHTVNVVPAGTNMTVTVPPNPGPAPALSYTFAVPYTRWPQNVPLPVGMPIYAKWVDPPAPGAVFFNTGITPLTLVDYLYNAQSGEVGFAPQQQ